MSISTNNFHDPHGYEKRDGKNYLEFFPVDDQEIELRELMHEVDNIAMRLPDLAGMTALAYIDRWYTTEDNTVVIELKPPRPMTEAVIKWVRTVHSFFTAKPEVEKHNMTIIADSRTYMDPVRKVHALAAGLHSLARSLRRKHAQAQLGAATMRLALHNVLSKLGELPTSEDVDKLKLFLADMLETTDIGLAAAAQVSLLIRAVEEKRIDLAAELIAKYDAGGSR